MMPFKVCKIIIYVIVFVSHKLYCPYRPPTADEIALDHFDCMDEIYNYFSEQQCVLNHAKYALLILRYNDLETYKPYAFQYFLNLRYCLDATNVPSIYMFCDGKPEIVRKHCQNVLTRQFNESKNQHVPGYELFDEFRPLDCLVTAFNYLRMGLDEERASMNIYFKEYMSILHKTMSIKLEKTVTNEVGYLSPHALCTIMANRERIEAVE